MINESLIKEVTEVLKQKKLTIATAESCTGGLISNLLTNISGSSDYFERGVISYSNMSKMELLDVSDETINNHGAVSKQTAKEMAEGIRKKSVVDVGLSTTGIAGPTGGTPDKPVGTVYIGISTKNKTLVKEFKFKGNRLQNKESIANEAMKLLLDILR